MNRTKRNHRNVAKEAASIRESQDLVIMKMDLIPTVKRVVTGSIHYGLYTRFIEWRDKEGRVYFRQVYQKNVHDETIPSQTVSNIYI
jgi:hypothetical protein